MNDVKIRVSQKNDGIIYTLSTESLETLKTSLPATEPRRGKLFISYETKHDFEYTHASVFLHVVQILTGLSSESLENSGFNVKFVNTRTGEEIRENVAV